MMCPRGAKLRCGYEEAEADASADDPERSKTSVNAGGRAIVNRVRQVENDTGDDGDGDDVVLTVTAMVIMMMWQW